MSIASTTNRNDYTGNGSVDTYAYGFQIFNQADLLVTVRDDDGVESTLTLTTHYTVSGVRESTGGNVALVNGAFDWIDGDGDLKTGYHITIRRQVDIVQETDIRNQGSYYPETHEETFDYLTMIDQQQQDEIDRSSKMPETVSSSVFDPTLPASLPDNPGAVVMVNDTGDGFELGPTADEIIAAQTYAGDAATSAAAAAASATTSGNSATASAASAVASAASAATAVAAVNSVFFRDVVFLTFADSPYTLSASDRGKLLVFTCAGGAITVNLPAISGLDLSSAFVVGLKKSDAGANAITINRNGTDTIDGLTSKTITVGGTGCILVPDIDPSPDQWTSTDLGTVADSSVTAAKTNSNMITGQTAETSIAEDDVFLLYDTSEAALNKATKTNLLKDVSVTKTTSGSISTSEFLVYATAASADTTLTLPAATNITRPIVVIRTDDSVYNVIIVPNGSDTIATLSSLTINQKGMVASLIADGSTNYNVLYKGIFSV